MSSPRKINRQLKHGYIIEIMELCQNINLYAVSLLVDYSHLFSEEEKRNINNYIDKIESYIELLNGFKQLLIKGNCHSSNQRRVKNSYMAIHANSIEEYGDLQYKTN